MLGLGFRHRHSSDGHVLDSRCVLLVGNKPTQTILGPIWGRREDVTRAAVSHFRDLHSPTPASLSEQRRATTQRQHRLGRRAQPQRRRRFGRQTAAASSSCPPRRSVVVTAAQPQRRFSRPRSSVIASPPHHDGATDGEGEVNGDGGHARAHGKEGEGDHGHAHREGDGYAGHRDRGDAPYDDGGWDTANEDGGEAAPYQCHG